MVHEIIDLERLRGSLTRVLRRWGLEARREPWLPADNDMVLLWVAANAYLLEHEERPQ